MMKVVEMVEMVVMVMTALLIPKLDRLVAIGQRQKSAAACNPFLVCDLPRSEYILDLKHKIRKIYFHLFSSVLAAN